MPTSTYPFSIPVILGLAFDGATMSAQLFDVTDGTAIGSLVTDGFLDRGGGDFIWTGNLPNGISVGVDFYADAVKKATTVVNHQEAYDISAILGKVLPLSAGEVSVNSPVTPDGEATIYAGYDGTIANGFALSFTDDGSWGDLSGATVFFAGRFDNVFVLSAGSVAGDPQVATFEYTAQETKYLPESDDYIFDVYRVIGDDSRPLIKDGVLHVTRRLD